MSKEISMFRCKIENFETISEKWRKLGYKVYFHDIDVRNDDMIIVGKYKIQEDGE